MRPAFFLAPSFFRPTEAPPARGRAREEVAAEVIDGPQSRVWGEAENRLHIQNAIMAALMGGDGL